MIPAMLQDRAIETGLLPHHAAGLLDCSASAGGHVRGLQVFDADHAKPAHKGRGGFMVPMLAYARGFGLTRGGAAPGLSIALRSTLAARGFLLRFPVPPVENAKTLNRHRGKFTRRKGDGVGITAIYPNARVRRDNGVLLELDGERHMPVPARAGYGHGAEVCAIGKLAGLPETYPADLRQPDFAPTRVQPAHRAFARLNAKAFVLKLPARLREPGTTRIEVLEGSLKVFDGVQFGGLRDGGDPIELAAQELQVCGVRVEADEPAFAAEVLPLKQGGVVNGAARPGPLSECSAPGLRWRKAGRNSRVAKMADLSSIHYQIGIIQGHKNAALAASAPLRSTLTQHQAELPALQAAVDAAPTDQGAKDALLAKQTDIASVQYQIDRAEAMLPDYERKLADLNSQLSASQ